MAVEPVDDCISFVGMEFIDNTLYFKENLESDHFGRLEPTLSVIRNLNGQVLFVDQGNKPVFEDMTDSECEVNAPRTVFIIFRYKDSQTRGLAVTISVQCEQRISTLSCENKIISFKGIDPPENISNTRSDMIFFMRSVPGHERKMLFESSLYPRYYLACKKDAELFKLILKENIQDEDKSVMFTVEKPRN
ncbi:interleukin-18 isoform X2 [Tamandua tetradactyla]|uniref:interleukin-18 isoform X2 n=1 Tax=Tamandua tetradactyla TaxID=48850 RepID=UPI004053E9E1